MTLLEPAAAVVVPAAVVLLVLVVEVVEVVEVRPRRSTLLLPVISGLEVLELLVVELKRAAVEEIAVAVGKVEVETLASVVLALVELASVAAIASDRMSASAIAPPTIVVSARRW